ncbi:MAG TPA: shikimate kinase, partial [Patescibacteria group bacterium]|nr:shikimate kinase [Patescibacteria group bacterium]
MKIIFIGFMGSGKSSLTKLLGEKMQLPTYEMDTMIVEKSGLASIPEIFRQRGETSFRDLETEVAKDISKLNEGVISSGGGVVTKEETMKYLKQGSILIYLTAPFATIAKRIGKDTNRPLFQDTHKAQELFTKRQSLYAKYADFVVSTNDQTKQQVLEKILERIK